jgi:hypothetical protein
MEQRSQELQLGSPEPAGAGSPGRGPRAIQIDTAEPDIVTPWPTSTPGFASS